MKPINFNELPEEIKKYITNIDSIIVPRQGYTSDVIVIKSNKKKYVLKRTKGEYHCTLLKREVMNLEVLSQQNSISTPKVHLFLEKEPMESWILMQCIEGETV